MSYTLDDTLAPAALTQGRAEATLAGETLGGRYDVLELVGIGGMGAVYRARDRELDEIVALKVIRRQLAELPAMVERFRHEVKLARRVTHANVARTFEIGTADGLMFCTMELVEGESLAARLKRGALPVGEAVTIACSVCDGLAAAHSASVVHRDIKPDNILIAHDGRVVLADFGVAAAGMGGAGELSGTLAYMPPEQARGEAATAAADVYALGVVLYEMLTGDNPFAGDAATILAAKRTVERLTPGPPVPAALADVVARATAGDRAHRLTTAGGLRRALEPWTTTLRRIASQPMRAVTAIADMATVVVLPPPAIGHPQQYLATAVHEEVLARLTKMPRVRVLPRTRDNDETPTYSVGFDLGGQLAVHITPLDGPAIQLGYPFGVQHVQGTADSVVATVDSLLTRTQHRDERTEEATDKMLQARHIAYRDVTRMPEAVAFLQQARSLAPQDPRIAATLAIAYIRYAFFNPVALPNALAEARLLATAAVTTAPQLADGHIALGHLELTAGAPVRAASHFRIAISRAPQLAEAHEQLGRMLLEAGYLELARARLDEAVAIAPDLRSAQWEISRALALDGQWEAHDRLVAELRADHLDRPLSRVRYAWWRGDWDAVRELYELNRTTDRVLFPGIMQGLLDVFLDKAMWPRYEAALRDAVTADAPNLRRRVFIAQLACEAAAFAGSTDSVVWLLEQAAANGLFDLHWLDRCPMLQPYQDVPGVQAVRVQIQERAVAILDALYGDHTEALSETQIA